MNGPRRSLCTSLFNNKEQEKHDMIIQGCSNNFGQNHMIEGELPPPQVQAQKYNSTLYLENGDYLIIFEK